MVDVRYALRRAKTAAQRAGGKKWVAQAEFPGGRTIEFTRTRTRPPAVTKLQTTVTVAAQAAGTAAATPDHPYNPVSAKRFNNDSDPVLE